MIPLTPRQTDIVRCLLRGMSNKEIGRALGISTGTVKAHLHVIFDKLAEQRINSRGKLAWYFYGQPGFNRRGYS